MFYNYITVFSWVIYNCIYIIIYVLIGYFIIGMTSSYISEKHLIRNLIECSVISTLQSVLCKQIGLLWCIFVGSYIIPWKCPRQTVICIVHSGIFSHPNRNIAFNRALQTVEILSCHRLVGQRSSQGLGCPNTLCSLFSV